MLQTVLLESASPCRSEASRFLLALTSASKADLDLTWFQEFGEAKFQKPRLGQLLQPGTLGLQGASRLVLAGYNNDFTNKAEIAEDGYTLKLESGGVVTFDAKAYCQSPDQGSQTSGVNVRIFLVMQNGVEERIDLRPGNFGLFNIAFWTEKRVISTQPYAGLRFKNATSGDYIQLELKSNNVVQLTPASSVRTWTQYAKAQPVHSSPSLIGSGTLSDPYELFTSTTSANSVYGRLFTDLPYKQTIYYKLFMQNSSTQAPNSISLLAEGDNVSWAAYADASYSDLRAVRTGRVMVLTGWPGGTTLYLKQELSSRAEPVRVLVQNGDSIFGFMRINGGEWDVSSLVQQFSGAGSAIGPAGSGDGSQLNPYILDLGDSGDKSIDSIATWAGGNGNRFYFAFDAGQASSQIIKMFLLKKDLPTLAQTDNLRFALFEDSAYTVTLGGSIGYGGSTQVSADGLNSGIGSTFIRPSGLIVYGYIATQFNDDNIYGANNRIRTIIEADATPASPAPGAIGTGVGSWHDPYVIAVNNTSTIIDIDSILPAGLAAAENGRFYMIADISSLSTSNYVHVFHYRDAQTNSPEAQFFVNGGRFYQGSSSAYETGVQSSNGLFTSTTLNPSAKFARSSPYDNVLLISTGQGFRGQGLQIKVLIEEGPAI